MISQCRQNPVTNGDIQVVTMLLGGEIEGFCLPYWGATILDEDEPQHPLAEFADTIAGEDQLPVWGQCGLYQVAGFLYTVDFKRFTVRKNTVAASNRRVDRRVNDPHALMNRQGTAVYD